MTLSVFRSSSHSSTSFAPDFFQALVYIGYPNIVIASDILGKFLVPFELR
jgi:hypothetical protein